MELSKETIGILSNFAQIQPNIVIHEGNELMTLAQGKNIVARATVSETFPKTFGVYDLPELLSAISLVSGPQIKLEENFAVISDSTNRVKIKYFMSSPDNLTHTSKGIAMPDPEVTFVLDNDTMNKVRKAASSLGHEKLLITASNGVINLTVTDEDDDTSNAFSIDVDGEFEHENFKFVFNINTLKMIPGDYNVQLSSKLISQFDKTDEDLTYWIALEKQSKYGN
jgi:hypothetical protein